MTRYCSTSQVDPQHLDRCRERHAAVRPEMLEALRNAGWHDHSLFLSDTGLLIGCFEVDDEDVAQARMAASEVNARWQAEMATLFTDGGNSDEGSTDVPEVFHLADQLRAAGLPADPRPGAGNRSADRPPTAGPVRSRRSLRRGHDDGERE